MLNLFQRRDTLKNARTFRFTLSYNLNIASNDEDIQFPCSINLRQWHKQTGSSANKVFYADKSFIEPALYSRSWLETEKGGRTSLQHQWPDAPLG